MRSLGHIAVFGLLAVLAHIPMPSLGYTDCIVQAAHNVTEKCQVSGAAAQQECASSIMAYGLLPCLQQASDIKQQQKVLPILVPKIFPPSTLKNWASGFANETGIKVVFTEVDFLSVVNEVHYEVQSNVSLLNNAGWMLDPSGISLIANLGGLADLGPYIAADKDFQWNDITPFFRNFASVFDHKIVSIPLDGDQMLMYYRSDVLATHNLSVPQTWVDFMKVAAALNGSDYNNDGVPDYSVCMDRMIYCKTSFNIISMLAPYIQYQGTSQGVFYDPQTVQALANNTAMQRVLTMYQELGAYSHPETANSCGTSQLFNEGRCALTINWGDQFKGAEMSNTSQVRTLLGVASLPGATEVLNRTTGELVPCTRDLCPYAELLPLQDGSHALVNKAPYSAFGGWVGTVSSLVSPALQDAAYKFWAYLAGPKESLVSVARPDTGFDPFRAEHLNLEAWVDMGYDRAVTLQYLDATESGTNSGNMVQDIRILNGGDTRITVMIAVGQMLARKMPAAVAAAYIQNEWMKTLRQSPKAAALYRASISWVPPPAPAAAQTATLRQSPRLSNSRTVAAIAAPCAVGGALIIGAALLVWAWKTRDGRRTLFGKIAAPGVGAGSTLVVTDIQDSTVLWERLAPEVMDAALKEHHRAVRQLLVMHAGYESGTEGDSFILAFHGPDDAVKFCAALQDTLLNLDWPQELLAAALCEPVYAAPCNDKGTGKVLKSQQMLKEGLASIQAAIPSIVVDAVSAVPEVLPPGGDAVETEAKGRGACTYRDSLLSAWPAVQASEASAVLVFRGLRVRIGVHSGIMDQESVIFNSLVQRTQYTGDAMVIAKAVCDAAQGGMVLISKAAFQGLHMENMGQQLVIMHSGCHELKSSPTAVDLYQVASANLQARLPRLDPIRSICSSSLGALEAPSGCMSVVFMYVVGAQQLLAWDTGVARHSMQMLQELAARELAELDGYMVEQADDILLTAFQSAEAACEWSLSVIGKALQLPWPQELLEQPLGEAIVLQPQAPAPSLHNDQQHINSQISGQDGLSEPSQVLFRGLRLKAGIDTGCASGSPHGTTGRITYRGRVMNRAARIASTATSGQVLSSEETYTDSRNSSAFQAAACGAFQLKGLPELMTLYKYSPAEHPGQRASARSLGFLPGSRAVSIAEEPVPAV